MLFSIHYYNFDSIPPMQTDYLKLQVCKARLKNVTRENLKSLYFNKLVNKMAQDIFFILL